MYIIHACAFKNHIEINTYKNMNKNTFENTEVWVLEVGDMGPGGPLIIIIIIIKGPYFQIELINTYLNLTICGDLWAFDHLWYLLTRCLVHFLYLEKTDQRWRKADESPQIARFR